MEDIRKALDDLGAETRGTMAELRGEMNQGFDEMDRALDMMQRAIVRQQHSLDEGLAAMDGMLERHRENIGTIIYTYDVDPGFSTDPRSAIRTP